jgi:hypothetical protein
MRHQSKFLSSAMTQFSAPLSEMAATSRSDGELNGTLATKQSKA